MEIRPIFFKDISFFDVLEGSISVCGQTVAVWEGRIEQRDSSFPK